MAPWTTRQKGLVRVDYPWKSSREKRLICRGGNEQRKTKETERERERERESEIKKARVPSICFRDCIVEHLLRYVPRASKCCYKIKA